MNKRTEAEIKTLILDTAQTDSRVRAVLLNGSRANPNILPDQFQDFDVVFFVSDIDSFTDDHSWIDIFGERVILQMPEEMVLGTPSGIAFSYLMLFKDGNRIDLTLFPIENLAAEFTLDSLTIVWLDKDNLFPNEIKTSDKDYHITQPTEREFLDVCNEFWWVSTYVAKGLARNEITYAKEMLETVVRPMFMKVINWKIGIDNDFSVTAGKSGKFIHKYLSSQEYEKVLATYSDHTIQQNWKSLFTMTDLFSRFAKAIAADLKFPYKMEEEANTTEYLSQVLSDSKLH